MCPEAVPFAAPVSLSSLYSRVSHLPSTGNVISTIYISCTVNRQIIFHASSHRTSVSLLHLNFLWRDTLLKIR